MGMKKFLGSACGVILIAGGAIWVYSDFYKQYHSVVIPLLVIGVFGMLFLFSSENYVIHFLGESRETHRKVAFVCTISFLVLSGLLTIRTGGLESLVFGAGLAVAVETYKFFKARPEDDEANPYSEPEDMIK
jgi:hypothetical protein